MILAEETKISLEEFQRHFLLTHMQHVAPCVLDQLEERANEPIEPFASLVARLVAACYERQTAFRDDNWYSTKIALDQCYFAHPDFRHRSVPKDGRFVDFLDSQLHSIESGSFPCSWEICSPWTNCMPRSLVEERLEDGTRGRGSGRFYVLDGQLRVIRHWYHQQAEVPVFIYRGTNDV